jgi:putrescine transport system permease protein
MSGSVKKYVLIAVPFAWLLIFFLFPFGILLYISFVQMGEGLSPFSSNVLDSTSFTLSNYQSIFTGEDEFLDTIYIEAFIRSLIYSGITSIFCLLIGFPFAYFVSRQKPSVRSVMLLMIMLPFWTSFLLRVYAWKGILADGGVINQFLQFIGVVDEPVQLLYTDFAMLVGMVYVYLPFMVLPLYTSLTKINPTLYEAAEDLGSRPLSVFFLVTVPLCKAGIIAGLMLVFIPAVGEFVIPSLLGGADNILIGRVVWDELFSSNNWPRSSALAIVLTLLIVPPMALYYHFTSDEH